MRQNRYQVALATPSVLYAPLYIAKQVYATYGFRYVDFRYSERLSIGKQGRSTSPNRHDTLTDALLTKVPLNRRSPFVLAVGDPLRFADVAANAGYEDPVVVACLLQRMCYWIIDEDTRLEETVGLHSACRKIIAHPKYMTGYRLLRYDLKVRHGVSDRDIDKLLYDGVEPGFERAFYERCRKKLGSSSLQTLGPTECAYLSTDLVEAMRKQASIRNVGIRWIVSEKEYANATMTAIVASRRGQTEYAALIQDLVGGIADAVRAIGENPEKAAAVLTSYHDESIDFRTDYSSDELVSALEFLNDSQVYYRHPARQAMDEATLHAHLLRASQIHSSNRSLGELPSRLATIADLPSAQPRASAAPPLSATAQVRYGRSITLQVRDHCDSVKPLQRERLGRWTLRGLALLATLLAFRLAYNADPYVVAGSITTYKEFLLHGGDTPLEAAFISGALAFLATIVALVLDVWPRSSREARIQGPSLVGFVVSGVTLLLVVPLVSRVALGKDYVTEVLASTASGLLAVFLQKVAPQSGWLIAARRRWRRWSGRVALWYRLRTCRFDL